MPQVKPLTQAQLDVYLKRIRDIPSLPEVVYKITDKLNKPGTPASEISNLIAFDPGLTTRIIRMVNSASLGLQKQVHTIQHAIMLLGFSNTRNLVLSASILRIFEGSMELHQALWKHSLMTAFASRLLYQHYEFNTDEDAFSAALLHNIGQMVLIMLFKEGYNDTIAEQVPEELYGYQRQEQTLRVEKECFGITHTEVGAQLALQWKLPPTLTDVIHYHHTPQKATLEPTMVFWIACAQQLVDIMLQLPETATGEEILAGFSPEVVKYFSLDEGLTEELVRTLRHEIEQNQDWFAMFQ
jgi:putative nucleotidyltransferase with HDIG domain